MKNIILLIVVVLGFVWCQDVDNINLEEHLNGIEDIDQYNKSAQDLDKALREKCDKNAGPGAYDAIKNMKDELKDCFQSQINGTVLMEELEESKKTGSMDEVFAKYCKKTPYFMNCTKSFTAKVETCLESREKDNMKIILNVTKNLAEFVCNKDGDRLAMFVAEGGKECLESQKEALQQCANKTLGSHVPNEITADSLPLLLFDTEQCANFVSLQQCVVEELEKCDDKTPANIVEALFKFIYKSIPCKVPQNRNTIYKRETQIQDNATQYTFNEQQFVDQTIRTIFYNKCLKYASAEKYFAVEKSVNDLQIIVRNIYSPSITCKQYKLDVIESAKKVMFQAEPCFSQDEKYITDFMLRGTDAALNYLCKDDDLTKLKKIFDPYALQCLASGNTEILNRCVYNSQTTKPIRNNEVIVSKEDLCRDLNEMNNCLTNYISLQCPQFNDFKTNMSDLLKAFTANCRPQRIETIEEKKAPSNSIRFFPNLMVVIVALGLIVPQ